MGRSADTPLIPSLDDLLTREELMSFFQVSASAIDGWKYANKGNRGEDWPTLPFLRVGRRTYFSKAQVAWWLNKLQERDDPYHIGVMNRRSRKGR